jgi:hypothetical protein
MGYYMVRMTNTVTREFAVKTESKEEAVILADSMTLALKHQKDESKIKGTQIRKTHDDSYVSTEVCETNADFWTASLKTRK